MTSIPSTETASASLSSTGSQWHAMLQAAGSLEAQVVCQHVWGARPGHRDELILRDRIAESSGSASVSSTPSLSERLWSLMDYYDPTSVVDTEGAVVERYRFSAFGLRSIMAPDFSQRATSEYEWDFGFKGQFLDLDTGYYNYGYRYYSPELGRWLSRDPIGETGDENLYEFSGSNPVNELDILGLVIVHRLNSLTITSASEGRGGHTKPEIIKKRLTSQPVSDKTGYCKLQFTEVYWQIRAYVGPHERWNEFPNGFNLAGYIKCKNKGPFERYYCAEGLSYQGVVVHEETHVKQFESIEDQIAAKLREKYASCRILKCTEAEELKKELESDPAAEIDRDIYAPIFAKNFPGRGGFPNTFPGHGEYEATVAEWNYYDTLIKKP